MRKVEKITECVAKKIGEVAIKMGKKTVQKSTICGLFEPKFPKQLIKKM